MILLKLRNCYLVPYIHWVLLVLNWAINKYHRQRTPSYITTNTKQPSKQPRPRHARAGAVWCSQPLTNNYASMWSFKMARCCASCCCCCCRRPSARPRVLSSSSCFFSPSLSVGHRLQTFYKSTVKSPTTPPSPRARRRLAPRLVSGKASARGLVRDPASPTDGQSLLHRATLNPPRDAQRERKRTNSVLLLLDPCLCRDCPHPTSVTRRPRALTVAQLRTVRRRNHKQ